MEIGDLIQSFWPLPLLAAIVAAIVVGIVAWRRREGLAPEREEGGAGATKVLYFYFATFAYMMVASVGVVLIARYVLDEIFGPPRLDRDVTQLALGVVLALIWTPVWIWHRSRVQRLLLEDPAQRHSVLRKVSIYLTLGVTAALVAQASVEILRWSSGPAAGPSPGSPRLRRASRPARRRPSAGSTCTAPPPTASRCSLRAARWSST